MSTFADPEDDALISDLRLKHLSGISIRNLTPYPKRDSFTSTLTETSAASIASDHAYVPDDADLTISRRRARKISSSSVATLRSLRAQDDLAVGRDKPSITGDSLVANDGTMRARRYSKPQSSSSSPIAGPGPSTSSSRGRSSSQTSPGLLPGPPSPSSSRSVHDPFSFHKRSSSFSGPGPVTIQRSLEKVMKARLVETIVTLEVPNPHEPSPQASNLRYSRSKSPPAPSKRWEGHPRATSATTSSRRSSTHTPSNPDRLSQSPPHAPADHSQHPSINSNPYHLSYVSPTHSPSTNPSWTNVDLEEPHMVASGASDTKVHLNLWVNVEDQANRELWTKVAVDQGAKGKGKAGLFRLDYNWELVLHWDLDLAEAEPLTPEQEKNSDRLPVNSPVIAVGHPPVWYWFPDHPGSTSFPHLGLPPEGEDDPGGYGRRSRQLLGSRWKAPPKPRRDMRAKLSATLQDMIRIVTLESVLRDTRASVESIIAETDQMIDEDKLSVMTREVEERTANLLSMRESHEDIFDKVLQARSALEEKRDLLGSRWDALSRARALVSSRQKRLSELSGDLEQRRQEHGATVERLNGIRIGLVGTVDFIFPIEVKSSQDLLFGILDVPLPLPLGPTDPAPPLSILSHSTVSEQSIATALGYAAQVVNLISIYLGRLLPYPITYASSRSMIKDPISSMQGPRIFPLFPTGVETYRFEYAVFLLNKDIEILMSERDLRALDMRHTLPNLKNLLLTLTKGVAHKPSIRKSQLANSATVAEARTEVRDGPQDDATATESVFSSETLPRKQFLSPLAAMLRSKYSQPLQHPPKLKPTNSRSPLANNSHIASESTLTDSQDMNGTPTTAGDLTNASATLIEDDASTERGVVLDATRENNVSKETLKAPGHDGYKLAGNVLSSFFWRSPARSEAEKEREAVAQSLSIGQGSVV